MRIHGKSTKVVVYCLIPLVFGVIFTGCPHGGQPPPATAPAEPAERVLVIGHRGAAGLAPENTPAAFARACEVGVDGIITDRPDVLMSLQP